MTLLRHNGENLTDEQYVECANNTGQMLSEYAVGYRRSDANDWTIRASDKAGLPSQHGNNHSFLLWITKIFSKILQFSENLSRTGILKRFLKSKLEFKLNSVSPKIQTFQLDPWVPHALGLPSEQFGENWFLNSQQNPSKKDFWLRILNSWKDSMLILAHKAFWNLGRFFQNS